MQDLDPIGEVFPALATWSNTRRISRLERQFEDACENMQTLNSQMQTLSNQMSEVLAVLKQSFGTSEPPAPAIRKIPSREPSARSSPTFPFTASKTPAIRFPSPSVSIAAERQRKSTFYALRSSRISHSQESHLGMELAPIELSQDLNTVPNCFTKEPIEEVSNSLGVEAETCELAEAACEDIIVNNCHTPTASTFCSVHGVLSTFMALGSVLSRHVTWPALKEYTVHQNSIELVMEVGKLRPDPEPPPLGPPLL